MTVIWWVAANVALYLQLAQPVVPLPPGLMIKPEYSERRAIHVLITDNIKVCQPSLGGSCVGQAHNGICKLSREREGEREREREDYKLLYE